MHYPEQVYVVCSENGHKSEICSNAAIVLAREEGAIVSNEKTLSDEGEEAYVWDIPGKLFHESDDRGCIMLA